jgi:hypothetical protein
MTYDTALHRNAVLRDLRSLTDPKRWRKYKYKTDQAKYIKEAILREAPLLTGFFADEPSWRSKVLLWCDKVLAHHVTKNS